MSSDWRISSAMDAPLRLLSATNTEGYVLRDKVGAKYGSDMSQFDQPGDVRYTATLVPERINAQ